MDNILDTSKTAELIKTALEEKLKEYPVKIILDCYSNHKEWHLELVYKNTVKLTWGLDSFDFHRLIGPTLDAKIGGKIEFATKVAIEELQVFVELESISKHLDICSLVWEPRMLDTETGNYPVYISKILKIATHQIVIMLSKDSLNNLEIDACLISCDAPKKEHYEKSIYPGEGIHRSVLNLEGDLEISLLRETVRDMIEKIDAFISSFYVSLLSLRTTLRDLERK